MARANAMMQVSVVICTRNRAASLARTLETATRMDVPKQLSWELLVVNNASTDCTPEVIGQYRNRLPIREVTEPAPGLSHARNRAIASALGDYIIWTDDDVLLDRDWLHAYVDAFRQRADAAVFGGPILPQFERCPPPWVSDCLELLDGLLAYRDFGETPLPLSVSEGRLPFGANFAVRSAEQRDFPYDPQLGARPGRVSVGEETAVITAMLASGCSGRWVPAAKVMHCISPDRLSSKYLSAWFRGYGATLALATGRCSEKTWLGVPRWLWRRMLTRAARYYFSRMSDPPQVWIAHLRRYQTDRGMVGYWRSEAEEPASDRQG